MRGLLLAALVYGAATLYFTWPLARAAADHLYLPTPVLPAWVADALLVSWILAWDAHALVSDPTRLFDANAFYPARHGLTYSEHLLGDLPIFAPVWAATGNPILAVNVLSAASYFLTGLAMHLLARRWTGSTVAAYAAGLAFAFAPWRAAGPQSPHLLQLQYLPLALLCLDATATTGRLRPALLAAAFLTLQTLCSYYLGYAAFVVAGTYLFADLAIRGARGRGRGAWCAVGLALAAPLSVVAAVSVPYLRVKASGQLPVDPTFVAAARHAARLLLTPANIVRAYVGWGAALLGAIGALRIARSVRVDPPGAVRQATLLLATVAGFALARGQEGLFEGRVVPYDWLAAVVPGFENTRVAARFAVLCSFGASGLVAFAVAGLLAGCARTAWPRLARGAIGAGSLVIVLLPAWSLLPPSLLAIPTRENLPAAYPWLARHGKGGPLLELPIGSGPPALVSGARAMYFSIFHRLPILNGHTGYPPPSYRFLVTYADALPAPEALQLLVDCTGLRWVLVHDAPPGRLAAWDRLPAVGLRGVFERDAPGRDRLYEVLAAPRAGCARHLFEPGVTIEGRPVGPVRSWQGRIAVHGLAERVAPGAETAVTITVANDSAETWPSTSVDLRGRFALAAQWAVGGGLPESEQRIAVPGDVVRGGRIEFVAWLRHPSRPGLHVLRIAALQGDLVASDLRWEREVVVTSP